MREVYDAFVRDPLARAAYRDLLTALATDDVPQLFHCTAGKDRTGWAAALLLEIAGVDRDTIMADYLLTNDVSSATRDKYLALIAEHLGPEKVAVYEPTMIVEASYLQTAYDAVAELYGSIDGYLRDGLGLADQTIIRQLRPVWSADRLTGSGAGTVVAGCPARIVGRGLGGPGPLRRVIGAVVRLLGDDPQLHRVGEGHLDLLESLVALGFRVADVRALVGVGEVDPVRERRQQRARPEPALEHDVDLDAEHADRRGEPEEADQTEDQREGLVHARRLGDHVGDVDGAELLQPDPQQRRGDRAGHRAGPDVVAARGADPEQQR